MKSISTLFRQLSLIVVLISAFSLSAWGEEYNYTFTNTQFSTNETKSLNNVNWTLAGDGDYWGYDGTKGQQFGSSKKPYKSLTLSTSDIKGTITKIVINTSGASDINASCTVSVGETQYGSSTKLTTTATSYTFTGSASGEIKFSYTQTSSKALYIKLISITYTPEGEEPEEPEEPTTEYMITFGCNSPIETIDGKITNIPQLPTSCHDDYLTPIGWTTSASLTNNTTIPELVDANTEFTQDTKLYPIYSNEHATLITDTSTLTVGDKIVIAAAADYNYALSTTQNKNNRGQASITKVENKISISSDVQILTLEVGTEDGTFAFNTGSGYLYAASSSSNYLRTETELSANSSWEITIADGGVATVVAQGTYTRNTMQYNQSSSLFACYGSASQKAIALYKKVDGEETEYYICGDLTIESGTTHNITEKIGFSTLTIKSNLDEAGHDVAGQVAVTSGSLTAQKVVVEKTIDASRYFFFSLPFNCNIDDIVATGANGNLRYYDNYTIFYYDQKYAAEKTDNSKAWVEITNSNTTLKANQGYIIGYLVEEGKATIKFPSANVQTITAPATTPLNITDYTWYTENTKKPSQCGWNLIGMPYYQKVNASLNNVNHLSIPNEDGKTYNQTEDLSLLASIAPFTSFFVQVKAAPTFIIPETQSAAPMLRAKDVVAKATITLADANGGMDKTTIINNQANTADYEIGHDLVKWIGYAEIPQIYSIQGEDILAFNSLAMNNKTIIPLGVYAHADGDYTFSLSDKSIGNLEGWELYDSESGKAVALTDESLTVTLSKGTHEGRFSIRMEQGTTTDCECDMSNIVTYMNNGTFYIENMPAKAMVYIYDAVGRMIYATETTDTSFDYTFALRGVYNVVVSTEYNSITYKTIY
mgnify:CR=1 FL=1